MFEPVAITIIFGLGFSTVLTLGLVPVLCSLFYRVTFAGYKTSNAGRKHDEATPERKRTLTA